ncbi:MAG: hypothetical protein ABFD89_15965 [Bryobacteraceae bacterium]
MAAANDYFSSWNHSRAPQWAGFDGQRKTAALAQSARMLSRCIGVDIETETAGVPTYQPSYAVFEQALHILMTSDAIPDGDKRAPHWAGPDAVPGEKKDDPPPAIHPEAMAWLGSRGRLVYMMRG